MPDKKRPKVTARKIRLEIAAYVDHLLELQDVTLQRLRLPGPQCPLVNPLCPSDLCILPRGHVGTEQGYHVLGTTPYTDAERWPKDWYVPELTTVRALVEEGWRRQELLR